MLWYILACRLPLRQMAQKKETYTMTKNLFLAAHSLGLLATTVASIAGTPAHISSSLQAHASIAKNLIDSGYANVDNYVRQINVKAIEQRLDQEPWMKDLLKLAKSKSNGADHSTDRTMHQMPQTKPAAGTSTQMNQAGGGGKQQV